MREILKIREIGDPILATVCEEVDLKKIGDKEFLDFIKNLKATLINSGALGLAAPQVGKGIRVIAVRVHMTDKNKMAYEDMREIPLTVMINPKLKVIGNAKTNLEYEACASVPAITR